MMLLVFSDSDTAVTSASSANDRAFSCQFRTFFVSLFFRKFRSWNYGVLFILGLLLSNCHLSVCDTCHFPSRWAGKWFQKGVPGPILIYNGTISNKGECRDSSNGEKFLIENRIGDHCFRCVVINDKDLNVLQYKETYCDQHLQETPTLDSLCQQINGDAPLLSMFRLDAVPVPCPFSGPFKFSYSREHGECANPISMIDSCTDDSHLLFRFQACANVHGSESRNEELECLAEWKEGTLRYLVGRLTHRDSKTEEDKFRCFVFEKKNATTYLLAQSGDATCDGLLSATEGSRVMTLTKVIPKRPKCQFPSWFTGPRDWKTLGESLSYNFTHQDNSSFHIYNTTTRRLVMNVACVHDDQITENLNQLIAHVTFDCHNGYKCIRIHKRAPHVVEMQMGKSANHESEACSSHNLDAHSAEFVTLTTESPESGECPLEGIYTVQMASPRLGSHPTVHPICSEQSTLAAKCSDNNKIEFQAQCSIDEQLKSFQCHGSWEENGTYYLIATAEKTKKRFCIAFSKNEQVLHFSGSAEACLRNVHLGREGMIAFNMTNKGMCDDGNGGSSVHITLALNLTLLLAFLVIVCSR